MLRTLVRLSAILLSVCLVAGCATFGLHQTAQTTPKGKFEFGGVVTPIFVPIVPGFAGNSGFTYYPIPELYAKLGLSEDSDLGFRWAFGPGFGMDYKFRMASGAVDVAGLIGGAFYGAFSGGSGGGIYALYPRLILSHEDKPGVPWAFNVGFDYIGGFTTDTYGGSSGGGMVSFRTGFGLPFRAFESVRIMPELAINLPLSTSDDDLNEILPSGAGLLTLGVSIGSVAKRTPAPAEK